MHECNLCNFSVHMLGDFLCSFRKGFYFSVGRSGRGPLKGKVRCHRLKRGCQEQPAMVEGSCSGQQGELLAQACMLRQTGSGFGF